MICVDSSLIDKFRKLCNVDVVNLDFNDLNLNDYVKALIAMYKQIGFNKVYLNSVATVILAKYFKKHNYTVVSLIHDLHDFAKYFRLENSLNTMLEFSDILIFSSEFALKKYDNYFNSLSKKIKVFQSSYKDFSIKNIQEKYIYKKKLCENLNINSESKILLGCGSGFVTKGIDLFVRSAFDILSKNKGVHFVWLSGFVDYNDQSSLEYIKKILKNWVIVNIFIL